MIELLPADYLWFWIAVYALTMGLFALSFFAVCWLLNRILGELKKMNEDT